MIRNDPLHMGGLAELGGEKGKNKLLLCLLR